MHKIPPLEKSNHYTLEEAIASGLLRLSEPSISKIKKREWKWKKWKPKRRKYDIHLIGQFITILVVVFLLGIWIGGHP